MSELIRSYKDLKVFQNSFEAAMKIFELTKSFPIEERYSLVDQIRRSSRSVCANIAEAWRKRRYKAAFIAKMSDAESEAAETQVWLEFGVRCNYVNMSEISELKLLYDHIIGQIVKMIEDAHKWVIKAK
jgi:four helix bundle protein